MQPFMQAYQERINSKLANILPDSNTTPKNLHKAMRYACLEGGKRIRAMLVYAVAEALNLTLDIVDAAAIAIELVHAYSLVHDDLPAMDDDQLRHGKPCCHLAFDEATAILVGDALQSLAFNVLSKPQANLSGAQQLQMIAILSNAIGSQGMAGGQALDLAAANNTINLEELELIHRHKTAALITASSLLAATAKNNITNAELNNIKSFAENIGLAFQVCDDILDVTTSSEVLGKQQGSDLKNNKATYPALIGISQSKQFQQNLYHEAINNLSNLDYNFDQVIAIANFIIQRHH